MAYVIVIVLTNGILSLFLHIFGKISFMSFNIKISGLSVTYRPLSVVRQLSNELGTSFITSSWGSNS